MSWFSRLNPTPAFPSYTGPYQVGTVDVEIPSADLDSSCRAPEDHPATIAFRMFYPCEHQDASARPVRWIPQPQRATVSAFARFLGARSSFAEVFAYFPHLLYYINIPATRNAPLLKPAQPLQRWPVMFFSHGLAGSRNMYSHICGSLASHGIIVLAMDHRDGSSPIQHIRATDTTERKVVGPIKISHTPSEEVFRGRDKQLRIRLWELCQAHAALLHIDAGTSLNNLDPNTSGSKEARSDVLRMFKDLLDVHEPGKIAWSGHSFGACTTVQLVKSVFYASQPSCEDSPLLTLDDNAAISKQITASSPIALLDLWALPFNSPDQTWLLDQPLPCYTPEGPGGKAVTAVLSEAFVKWPGNLQDVKHAIAPPLEYKGQGPNLFYPTSSQHFSQSDFGILFPWITQRLAKTEDPERILKLNMRAVLQMLRDCDFPVADTSAEDKELVDLEDEKNGSCFDDCRILDADSDIRGWKAIPMPKDARSVTHHSKEHLTPADNLQNGRMEL